MSGERGRGDTNQPPQSMRWAVWGMYAGALLAALGLLRGLLSSGGPRERALAQIQSQQGSEVPPEQAETLATTVVVISVVGGLIAIALWVSMAILNSQGRKWARIVATVLGVLNVLSSLLGVGSGPPLQIALTLANIAVAVAVVTLLWTRSSGEWFSAMVSHRATRSP